MNATRPANLWSTAASGDTGLAPSRRRAQLLDEVLGAHIGEGLNGLIGVVTAVADESATAHGVEAVALVHVTERVRDRRGRVETHAVNADVVGRQVVGGPW